LSSCTAGRRQLPENGQDRKLATVQLGKIENYQFAYRSAKRDHMEARRDPTDLGRTCAAQVLQKHIAGQLYD